MYKGTIESVGFAFGTLMELAVDANISSDSVESVFARAYGTERAARMGAVIAESRRRLEPNNVFILSEATDAGV